MRIAPRVQTSSCSGCGRTLHELERRPCPRCGDTRRTIARTMDMTPSRRRYRWLPWPRDRGVITHDEMSS